MFEKLGHLIAKRAKVVLALSLIFIAISGTIGTQVFSRFDSGGYSDPGSDSAKVFDYLEDEFNIKDPAVVLTAQTPSGTVDDSLVAEKAARLEAQLRSEASAENVLSYWSAGRNPGFKSTDQSAAYLFVYLKSTDFTEIDKLGGYYQDKYEGDFEGLTIRVAGGAVFANSIN